MKFCSARSGAALVFLGALFVSSGLVASARGFVQDQAGMFSASTVAQLNERISSFNAATGKDVVVMTVPSLGGATLQSAAANAFSQQNVNGVLIFVARDDRRDIIVPDRAGVEAGWFPPDVLRDIRSTMESQFRSESYDAGITGAVDSVLSIYRAHSGQSAPQSGAAGAGVPASYRASRIGHISMFWWIIIIVGGFLILRSIMRAASGPRSYGGGMPPPGAAPGQPGYGAGYGPGYGYGGFGGGGNFWSGLLGGLGGAWLGNELFRGGGGGGVAPADAGQITTQDPGGGWGGSDSGGWQSDAGQADMGGASGGDWSGGGFGDSGGGFGDFGGGGGDSGGGW